MKLYNHVVHALTWSTACLATNIYVSSYSGNITSVSVTPNGDGTLSLAVVASTLGCSPNPSWLELDKSTSTLYCADEGLSTANANFTSFQTSSNGTLTLLDKIVTLNGGVYSKIYGGGSVLALANYGGSGISIINIDNVHALNIVQETTFAFQSPAFKPNSTNSVYPYIHETIIDPTDNFLLAPDLSADVIHVFSINPSYTIQHISNQYDIAVPTGHGPRHGVFYRPGNGSNATYFYIVMETVNMVHAYQVQYNADNTLDFTFIQYLQLPGSANTTGAEIRLTPCNQYLIVSTRSDNSFNITNPDPTNPVQIPSDSLLTISISPSNGNLTLVQRFPAGGSLPRQFEINKNGTMVAVALNGDNRLTIVGRNVTSGHMTTIIGNLNINVGGEGPGMVTCAVWDEDFGSGWNSSWANYTESSYTHSRTRTASAAATGPLISSALTILSDLSLLPTISSPSSPVSSAASLLAITASSPATTTSGNAIGIGQETLSTPASIQTPMTANCDQFYTVQSGDTCDSIATAANISVSQFISWNSGVGSSCVSLWLNYSVCIGVGSPTATIGNNPTSGESAMTTPVSIQTPIPANCNQFYTVQSGDTCDSIATAANVSVVQFISWNSGVGSSCASLWVNYSVCIGVSSASPSATTDNSLTSGQSTITTPASIQTPVPANCNQFYTVQSGDTCDSIATAANISLAQFLSWNSGVGSSCGSLWLNYSVCIGVSSANPSAYTSGSASSVYARQLPVSTPTNFEPGMEAGCTNFYTVAPGDTCDSIAAEKSVSVADFISWNPGVGASCQSLWLGAEVCVLMSQVVTLTSTAMVIPIPATLIIDESLTVTSTRTSTRAVVTPTNAVNTNGDCTNFYTVVAGDTCDSIASAHGIGTIWFITWNEVGLWACQRLVIGTNVCVGTSFMPAVSARHIGPVPTKEPGPTLGCINYHTVVSGDTCDSIALSESISLTGFMAMNPSVGTSCQSLLLGSRVCVFMHAPAPNITTTEEIVVATVAPTNARPGTVDDCTNWYTVAHGDTCDSIASAQGISALNFWAWNPSSGPTCANLWVGSSVCVGIQATQDGTIVPVSARQFGATPTTQPGIDPGCTDFYTVATGDTCNSISAAKSISVKDFMSWNPGAGPDCKTLWLGASVCIGVSQLTHVMVTQAPVVASVGPETPMHTQPSIAAPTNVRPGTVDDCTNFCTVVPGDTCDSISEDNGIDPVDFIAWNPSVGPTCATLWIGSSVCVGLQGTPQIVAVSGRRAAHSIQASTPTIPLTQRQEPNAANAIESPPPLQMEYGMVENCEKFYKVVEGDTCDSIAAMYGTDFLHLWFWNPAIGTSCQSLWLGYYICVGIAPGPAVSDILHLPPTRRRVQRQASPTPSPAQPSMASNCVQFYKVQEGDTCDSIAAGSGNRWAVSLDYFYEANPGVGRDCKNLWLGYYVCMALAD